eukprot:EG_transcript_1858
MKSKAHQNRPRNHITGNEICVSLLSLQAAGYGAPAAQGYGYGAAKPAAPYGAPAAYAAPAPKPAPKPAAPWGYPGAAKPAAPWHAAPKPAAPAWGQPAAPAWGQPSAPAWGQPAVPKPVASPWAAAYPKPAPKPLAAKPYAAPFAPKPAAPWGGVPQAKPAPLSAQLAIAQAKAAAAALRGVGAAVARRPGLPVRSPLGIAKPAAIRPPVSLAARGLVGLTADKAEYQKKVLAAAKAAEEARKAQILKIQEDRKAIAAKAIKAAQERLGGRLAAQKALLLPKIGKDGKPIPGAKPGAELSPATSAALAAIAAAAAGTDAEKAKKAARIPWIEQLTKSTLNPWDLVDRTALDLLQRFPNLILAPDLVHVTCHYGKKDWRGLIQTDPLVETLKVDESKDQVRETDVELPAGDKKRIVRVALFTGKLLAVQTHVANRMQFAVHKAAEPACLPGGAWDAKLDGADPEKLPTLKKTAVRILKTLYGVDLSSCKFHRFLDLKYVSEEGEQSHTTVLFPELWPVDDLPLGLGRVVREKEQEVVTHVTEEEPMTEEDKEAAKKEYFDRIARQRAEANKPRPGEREVERFERIERLEETLKELEKTTPIIKDTKTVKKEVKETKTVKQEISKPAFLSLQTMRELSQLVKEGPPLTSVFETKLFALCFDELVRLENGLQIVEWFQEYKTHAKEASEQRAAKHKRDLEQIKEREELMKERLAKRKKLEEEKKKEEETKKEEDKVKATLREAEIQELEQKKKEEAAKEEKKEGDVDLDTPLPPLKLTKYVYDYDETAAKPFLFFDSSAQAPCGSLSRQDLLQIFYRTGEHCQRDVQELVKATLIDTPAVGKVGAGLFSYKGACSTQREVEPEEAAAGEEKEKAADAVAEPAAAAE